MRSTSTAFTLAAAVLLAAAPLGATSFVLMPDEALVDSAPLVVTASVLSIEPGPAGGAPTTDYRIEVERLLKGDPPGDRLPGDPWVVRVPGGVGADGVGLRLWGAPAFAAGERVLLLLRPGDDGAFRVVQWMMGAFHQAEAGGESLWVRDLAEASRVPMPGEPEDARAGYLLPRRGDAFADWIEARARGVEAAADYFHRPAPGGPEPSVISDAFTVFCHDPSSPSPVPAGPDGECRPGSFPLRWFGFEDGTTARWRMHQDGQPGLTAAQATHALARALGVWTYDEGSDVRYRLDSPLTTDSTGGLAVHDPLNVILFDDPEGWIGEPFNCLSGGVLAVGGPWFTNAVGSHEGKQYLTIVNGDILTNDGLECFFAGAADPERLAAQLFAHEVGHTLGFGHSCSSPAACAADPEADAALMRAFIHGPDYGPELRPDDVAAALHHYRAGPTAPCVAGPDTLCLLDGRFRVEVDWHDQVNGGNGLARIQPSPVGGTRTGVLSFFNPANIELIVKMLDATGPGGNGHFWLFYGALSTVEYWVTVTDTATGRSKTYHNPPGQICGVPDTTAFPDGSAPAAAPAAAPIPAPVAAPFPADRLAQAPFTALPAAGASGTCIPSATTLCLADGRFEVTVDWTLAGGSGPGVAVPGSEKSGYFWFFNATNLELVVKVLDASTITGNWWVFYGALSNVEYTIDVRDTVTGIEESYLNPAGSYCGDADTGSFPDSP